MRALDAILTEINTLISDDISFSRNVFNKEATLQEKDGNTWPMARIGLKEGKKISPTDISALQIYYRQVSPQENAPTGEYKGNRSYVTISYKLRLVGIGARAMITSNTFNDNNDIANGIMEILTDNPVLSGGEIIMTDGLTNTNVIEVLNTEYANNEIVKKFTLDLIAFWIDFTVKQRRFGNC